MVDETLAIYSGESVEPMFNEVPELLVKPRRRYYNPYIRLEGATCMSSTTWSEILLVVYFRVRNISGVTSTPCPRDGPPVLESIRVPAAYIRWAFFSSGYVVQNSIWT